MASLMQRPRPPGSAWSLSMAFVERQTNLWKRYWAWELVWLLYGVVNTLAITYIAEEMSRRGDATADAAMRLTLFLMIGTLVWAYLSAVLDDIGMVVVWERWEGTIEHTLMAPVPRSLHLLGMCIFAILHGVARTLLIFGIALLFFEIDFSNADWLGAASVLAAGSVSVAGLAVLSGVLPLLYPERGAQMTLMVQATLLLISGVYFEVEVLPAWLRALSFLSPATYILDGVRGALIDGDGIADLWGTLGALAVFGVALAPLSVAVFAWAERYAKRTGKLKRSG